MNIFRQVIEGGGGPYKVYTASMVYMCTYEYKSLSLKFHAQSEESFMDAYVEEVFE